MDIICGQLLWEPGSLPVTTSTETPKLPGWRWGKFPQNTFSPLFLALFDLLQNVMPHNGSLAGQMSLLVPPRSL